MKQKIFLPQKDAFSNWFLHFRYNSIILIEVFQNEEQSTSIRSIKGVLTKIYESKIVLTFSITRTFPRSTPPPILMPHG